MQTIKSILLALMLFWTFVFFYILPVTAKYLGFDFPMLLSFGLTIASGIALCILYGLLGMSRICSDRENMHNEELFKMGTLQDK